MTQKKGLEAVRKRRATKKKRFLEAFEKSMGNVSAACKAIGISRETYYRWLDEDDKFAFNCRMVDESNLDYAETKLLSNIREGRETSLIFYLKTKGKHRGYRESIDVDATTQVKNEYADLTDEELIKQIEEVERKMK